MKRILPFFGILLFSFSQSTAQKAAPAGQLGCIEADTRLLSDEVKQHFRAQGFAIVRDAMIHMSSYAPLPVVVGLDRLPYQIVFVSNAKATEMDVEVMNPDRRNLARFVEKSKRTQKHVISFPFTPPTKDAYLFVMRQNLRQEETCGGFLILRDTLKNRRTPVVPF